MSHMFDSIKIINICEVDDEIYGDVSPYSDEGVALLEHWLEINDCAYYARCREDFFIFEAAEQAHNEGKGAVLVEDMS